MAFGYSGFIRHQKYILGLYNEVRLAYEQLRELDSKNGLLSLARVRVLPGEIQNPAFRDICPVNVSIKSTKAYEERYGSSRRVEVGTPTGLEAYVGDLKKEIKKLKPKSRKSPNPQPSQRRDKNTYNFEKNPSCFG